MHFIPSKKLLNNIDSYHLYVAKILVNPTLVYVSTFKLLNYNCDYLKALVNCEVLLSYSINKNTLKYFMDHLCKNNFIL